MDGLQNRMESTEQRISELEIKQQKVLNLNIREKIDQKKKNGTEPWRPVGV